MRFLQNWSSWRQFRRLPLEWRNIVVYSESAQDWHHFAPIIDELTGKHRRKVTYVTSQTDDPGLSQDNPGLSGICIEEGLFRTLFFQVCDADVFVLTMMDLDNLDLKRSINPVYYVYIFHGMGSTHMVDFANSYDHYDAIFCTGPHQMREIRKREALHDLPEKHLFPHGYHRLERLLERAGRDNAHYGSGDTPTVLIAPTWGEDSIFNRCGEDLVAVLLEAGFEVIARPHYHTLRRHPAAIRALRERFGPDPAFEYVDRMGESASLFRSHLLISDWSAMALEYAFGLEKPVLFIDLPRRVRNPDWQELGIEPVEASIRTQVGSILDPGELHRAPERIHRLLADPQRFRQRVRELREAMVFNLGASAAAAAGEIARLADERAARRAAGEVTVD